MVQLLSLVCKIQLTSYVLYLTRNDGRLILTKWTAGLPNGAAAGFFLAQHKRQLGSHKIISKVRVFRPDGGDMPYLLFYVEDAPPEGQVEGSNVEMGERDWTSAMEANAQPTAEVMRASIVKRQCRWQECVARAYATPRVLTGTEMKQIMVEAEVIMEVPNYVVVLRATLIRWCNLLATSCTKPLEPECVRSMKCCLAVALM